EICLITKAELKAVVTGLQLVWEKGYQKIRVQLDLQAVFQLLLGVGELTHRPPAIVRKPYRTNRLNHELASHAIRKAIISPRK
ncbi:hypothetical protein LINGRAHAP2_LOCUS9497, partial [Linum grandiflorum]